MAKTLRIGPFAFKAWRLWLLLGAWALGAGLVFGAAIFYGGRGVERFQTDSPDDIALRVRDAQTELGRGRPEVARDRLLDLRDEDPLNPMVHALLGQAYGRLPEGLPLAIASTRMALSLDPNFARAAYNLGCYYARMGDTDGAVLALSSAVAMGFEDRDALRGDADLAALRQDPRVAFFLGGRGLPSATRFARASLEPPVAGVGEPLTLVIEVWDLAPKTPEGEMALTFKGPGRVPQLSPISRSARRLTLDGGMVGWEMRYRLRANAPFAGQLGPFALTIGGQGVGLQVPPLKVEGPPSAEGAGGALEPRAFFSAPWPEDAAPSGPAPPGR